MRLYTYFNCSLFIFSNYKKDDNLNTKTYSLATKSIFNSQKVLLLAFFVCLNFLVLKAQEERIDIHFPSSDNVANLMQYKSIIVSDDEKLVFIDRYGDLIAFDIETGKLVAYDDNAKQLFRKHHSNKLFNNYTVKDGDFSIAVYDENGNQLTRVVTKRKFDHKMVARANVIKNTHSIIAYKGGSNTRIIHPDGREVKLQKFASNLPKNHKNYKVNMENLYYNLTRGHAYITADLNYSFDRYGRVVNLNTGEVTQFDYGTEQYNSNNFDVDASYDRQTSILKVSYKGYIHLYHLRAKEFIGKIGYRYMKNNEHATGIFVAFPKSNAQVFHNWLNGELLLVKDGKYVRHFENEYAKIEKENYDIALKKRLENNRYSSVPQYQSDDDYEEYSGNTSTKCKACSGTGLKGYTAAHAGNRRYEYKNTNGAYKYIGTSHNTYPIICGECWGRGYKR